MGMGMAEREETDDAGKKGRAMEGGDIERRQLVLTVLAAERRREI